MVCHPRQPCRRDEEAEILHALHKIEHLLGIETMRLGIDDVRTLHQMRQAMLAAAVGQRGPRVDRDPSGLVMLFSRSAAATCPTDCDAKEQPFWSSGHPTCVEDPSGCISGDFC